jgi:hypothetical protein
VAGGEGTDRGLVALPEPILVLQPERGHRMEAALAIGAVHHHVMGREEGAGEPGHQREELLGVQRAVHPEPQRVQRLRLLHAPAEGEALLLGLPRLPGQRPHAGEGAPSGAHSSASPPNAPRSAMSSAVPWSSPSSSRRGRARASRSPRRSASSGKRVASLRIVGAVARAAAATSSEPTSNVDGQASCMTRVPRSIRAACRRGSSRARDPARVWRSRSGSGDRSRSVTRWRCMEPRREGARAAALLRRTFRSRARPLRLLGQATRCAAGAAI